MLPTLTTEGSGTSAQMTGLLACFVAPLEDEELELLLDEDEDELPLTDTLKFWVLCVPQVLV